MITEDKLKMYSRYDGDIDSWARTSSRKEKTLMNDKDWFAIESLLQDLKLVRNGLASEEYKATLNEKLKRLCCTDAIEFLKDHEIL